MSEGIFGECCDLPSVFEDAQVGPMSQSSESNDDSQSIQQAQLAREKRATSGEFSRGRLVVGRRAMDRRGDVAIDEIQSVIGRDRGRLVCEACLVEGPIEEVSRSISGEHPTGTVGAMRSGGESNNQHLGIDWTKRGDRFAPILPVLVRFPLHLCDA